MFGVIIAILLILVAVGAFIAARWLNRFEKREDEEIEQGKRRARELMPGAWKIATGVGGVSLFIAVCVLVALSIYTQDPGQASVIVSFTGEVEGISYEPGLHAKAPWSSRIEYDIRNNTLSYVGTDGNTDNYTGGDVSGPQITFQDKNGVTGNIDLNVRYSVRGDAVNNIYNEYKTQQEFVNATLAPDVRAKTREVLSHYDTAQVYNERDKIQPVLRQALQEGWESLGVDIEDIYLQEVRYPQTVIDSFANAQAAKIAVETAKANQEKARVEAETNKIKTEALSDQVLKEKLIDAIRNGSGTYVLGGSDFAIGL